MDNFDIFTDFVKSECKKHGVHFKEYKRPYINYSKTIKCAGFFADGEDDIFKKPTLAYAKGNPDYMALLVHEYGHMTQWLDNIPIWKEATFSLDYLDRWLNGEDFDDIYKHIDIAKEIELDNEKRSVELIKKWGLPLDIPTYIRKANAYVQFYLYLKESRRWSQPNKSPYSVIEIIELMSDEFDMDYDTLDPKIRQTFIDHNI